MSAELSRREAQIAWLTHRLSFETDPSDVAAARAAGEKFALLDVRDERAWKQGHIPGAHHAPNATLLETVAALGLSAESPIVVYCWGVACNGSTKAALALAEAGFENVREMIGGYEYWVREGFAYLAFDPEAGKEVRRRNAPDPLTAPLA